ncbi:MAG TPA: hypothetical protein PKW33_13260 [Anaerolineaceae bacterium]|nr:hypothetical protein [Anaerolineaceae bacterium]HPN52553.1 hypothetical protein [Anaerolineaceae bacterium]
MTIGGPLPIAIIERPSGEQPLTLRVNQRITAQILNVSGDQVSLAIQGTRVVGRLPPGEQAGLNERRSAQFVVRGMADGVLQLQLVRQGTTPGQTTSVSQWQALAQNLLRLNGLQINQNNLTIASALLNRGLPVNARLVDELLQALGSLKNWGAAEADLAAMFKASNLPLTPGTLSLAMQHLPGFTDSLQQLQAGLSSLLKGHASAELKSLAQKVMTMLEGAVINWSGTPAEIAEQLSEAMALWGKTLEAGLAEQAKTGQTNPNDPLTMLAQLRQELVKQGENNIAGQVDRFMDGLRQMQFLNAGSSQKPGEPVWLAINFPLAQQNPPGDMFPANLRVAYREAGGEKTIDPSNTRLILNLELEEGETLQVDLSMAGKRVGAWMTVSSEQWRGLIDEELPSFTEGLEKLGFKLQFAQCQVQNVIGETDAASGQFIPWNAKRINLEA